MLYKTPNTETVSFIIVTLFQEKRFHDKEDFAPYRYLYWQYDLRHDSI